MTTPSRAALGLPGEATSLPRRHAHSGRPQAVGPFHFAFSLFRFAVMFERIASRVAPGHAFAGRALEALAGRRPDPAPLPAT